MGYVHYLRTCRETSRAVYSEFLQNYTKDPGVVYAFYEGYEDHSFYSGYFHSRLDLGQRVIAHHCKGIGNLLYVFGMVREKYDLSHFFFFTDKDFSGVVVEEGRVESEHIFVTSAYSVENYIPSVETLSRVLSEILHVTRRVDIDMCLELYKELSSKYYRCMLALSLVLISVRVSGVKPDFNKIKLDEIIDIFGNLEGLSRKVKFLLYARGLYGGFPFDALRFARMARELRSLPPKVYVRGKFDLWFFVQFVSKIQDLFRLRGRRLRVKTQLSMENAIDILSSKAPVFEHIGSYFDFKFSLLHN